MKFHQKAGILSAFLCLLLVLVSGCSAVENLPGIRVSTVTLPVLVTSMPAITNASSVPTAASLQTTNPKLTLTPSRVVSLLSMPTSTSIPAGKMPVSSCDQLNVLEDVTIPDGTAVKPGEIFVKSWRIQNTGNCVWNDDYRLVFFQGERMDVPSQTTPFFLKIKDEIDTEIGTWGVRIHKVEPKDKIDIALALRAPQTPGDYSSYWALVNSKGERIDPIFWVMVKVVADASPIENSWTGEWVIQDPFTSDKTLTRAVMSQNGKEVIGFFYNFRGNISLLSGWMEEGGKSIKGEYGEPWQDFSTPFEWKLSADSKRFQGILRKGNVSPSTWCGGRTGDMLPDPCAISIEN